MSRRPGFGLEPDLPLSELLSTVKRPSGGPWTTMLQVDVATGEVLLNRLGEVIGEMFGSYSWGSAFEDRDAMVRTPGYDSAGTLSRRRILGHAGRRARRR